MCHFLLVVSFCALTQSFSPPANHSRNAVFQALKAEGIRENGVSAPLPTPILEDGKDANAAMAAIKAVVGDDRAIRDLLKDSVSAPFVLKTKDLKAGDATIRLADLYFAVHASLEEIDLESWLAKANAPDVEAGNMRFGSRILAAEALRERKLEPPTRGDGISGWYGHATGRLLDRLAVESTDQVVATRTADSLIIAARTDHSFDNDPSFPNQWASIVRKGAEEVPGPRHIYAGGGSYVKLTRLAGQPGVLFVEAHLGFVEPQGWFQGAPILRSKLALIAQDQVRQIRREIEKNRAKK